MNLPALLNACQCHRNALEDPWEEPSETMFTRSVSPEQAPDKLTYLEVEFEAGDPVALDGERLSPAALLTRLNQVFQPIINFASCLQG